MGRRCDGNLPNKPLKLTIAADGRSLLNATTLAGTR